jgi:tRNA threonylcarbamoyladenosine biosynthesis protein TsaE
MQTSAKHVFRAQQLDDLPHIAREVVQLLPASGVVLFEGAMAAGKTTFIRALCAELGVIDEVSSPTYALVNEYHTLSGVKVYHFDLYRIEDPGDLLNIGIEEYFVEEALSLVEWPDRLGYLMPENALVICVEDCGDYRQISL